MESTPRRHAERAARQLAAAARWRMPQQHGVELPRARAGHAAALLASAGEESDDAIIAVHGGALDGGAPVAETLRLTLRETYDGTLDAIWEPAFGALAAEPAPGQPVPARRLLHSLVACPTDSGSSLLLFGGTGFDASSTPIVFGDLWCLDLPDAGAPSWSQLHAAGSEVVPPRWGHGAVLVGGLQGCGTQLLIAGGMDMAGVALCDVWVLELSGGPRWEAIARGGPAPAPAGIVALTWVEPWNAVLCWGGGGCELWRESPSALQRRLAKLRGKADAERARDAAEEAVARQRRREAKRQAVAEERRAREQAAAEERAARERAEQEEKAREKAELAEWAQRKRQQLLEQERAKREADLQKSKERQRLQEAACGGGFDLRKLNELRASGIGSACPAAVKPNFSGWSRLPISDSSDVPLAAGRCSAPAPRAALGAVPSTVHDTSTARLRPTLLSGPLRSAGATATLTRMQSGAALGC